MRCGYQWAVLSCSLLTSGMPPGDASRIDVFSDFCHTDALPLSWIINHSSSPLISCSRAGSRDASRERSVNGNGALQSASTRPERSQCSSETVESTSRSHRPAKTPTGTLENTASVSHSARNNGSDVLFSALAGRGRSLFSSETVGTTRRPDGPASTLTGAIENAGGVRDSAQNDDRRVAVEARLGRRLFSWETPETARESFPQSPPRSEIFTDLLHFDLPSVASDDAFEAPDCE